MMHSLAELREHAADARAISTPFILDIDDFDFVPLRENDCAD